MDVTNKPIVPHDPVEPPSSDENSASADRPAEASAAASDSPAGATGASGPRGGRAPYWNRPSPATKRLEVGAGDSARGDAEDEHESILAAVRQGDVERIRALLRGPKHRSATDGRGRTALHVAAASDKGATKEMIRAVVDGGGIDTAKLDDQGKSALDHLRNAGAHAAADDLQRNMDKSLEQAIFRDADERRAVALVKAGADPEPYFKQGALEKRQLVAGTAIAAAAVANIVATLWETKKPQHPKPAHLRDDSKSSPESGGDRLQAAIDGGDVPAFESLASKQRNVDATDQDGRTLLHRVIESTKANEDRKMAMVRVLVEDLHLDPARLAYPSTSKASSEMRDVSAHRMASSRGHHDIADYLRQKMTAEAGKAVFERDQRRGIALLRAGADPRGVFAGSRGAYGVDITHLQFAACSHQHDLMQAMLGRIEDPQARAAFIDQKGLNGNTAIHEAAHAGDQKGYDLLMDSGGSVRIRNDDQASPQELHHEMLVKRSGRPGTNRHLSVMMAVARLMSGPELQARTIATRLLADWPGRMDFAWTPGHPTPEQTSARIGPIVIHSADPRFIVNQLQQLERLTISADSAETDLLLENLQYFYNARLALEVSPTRNQVIRNDRWNLPEITANRIALQISNAMRTPLAFNWNGALNQASLGPLRFSLPPGSQGSAFLINALREVYTMASTDAGRNVLRHHIEVPHLENLPTVVLYPQSNATPDNATTQFNKNEIRIGVPVYFRSEKPNAASSDVAVFRGMRAAIDYMADSRFGDLYVRAQAGTGPAPLWMAATIGLGPFSARPDTENSYREQRGIDQRRFVSSESELDRNGQWVADFDSEILSLSRDIGRVIAPDAGNSPWPGLVDRRRVQRIGPIWIRASRVSRIDRANAFLLEQMRNLAHLATTSEAARNAMRNLFRNPPESGASVHIEARRDREPPFEVVDGVATIRIGPDFDSRAAQDALLQGLVRAQDTQAARVLQRATDEIPPDEQPGVPSPPSERPSSPPDRGDDNGASPHRPPEKRGSSPVGPGASIEQKKERLDELINTMADRMAQKFDANKEVDIYTTVATENAQQFRGFRVKGAIDMDIGELDEPFREATKLFVDLRRASGAPSFRDTRPLTDLVNDIAMRFENAAAGRKLGKVSKGPAVQFMYEQDSHAKHLWRRFAEANRWLIPAAQSLPWSRTPIYDRGSVTYFSRDPSEVPISRGGWHRTDEEKRALEAEKNHAIGFGKAATVEQDKARKEKRLDEVTNELAVRMAQAYDPGSGDVYNAGDGAVRTGRNAIRLDVKDVLKPFAEGARLFFDTKDYGAGNQRDTKAMTDFIDALAMRFANATFAKQMGDPGKGPAVRFLYGHDDNARLLWDVFAAVNDIQNADKAKWSAAPKYDRHASGDFEPGRDTV